jgi:hypothetical protein
VEEARGEKPHAPLAMLVPSSQRASEAGSWRSRLVATRCPVAFAARHLALRPHEEPINKSVVVFFVPP